MIIHNNAKRPDYSDPYEQSYFLQVYQNSIDMINKVGVAEFVPYFYDSILESFKYIENELLKLIILPRNSYYCAVNQNSARLSVAFSIRYTNEALDKLDRTHTDPRFGIGYVIELHEIIDGNTCITLNSPRSIANVIPDIAIPLGDENLVEKLKVQVQKLIDVSTSDELIGMYVRELIEDAGYKKRES